jgi:hypothetical protein
MAEWNQYETLKAWADIVIERWEFRVIRLGITDTAELLNSFHAQVVMDANGNGQKIEFTFAYYGQFIDMGAAKYAPFGSGKRSARPWYSKIFFSQVQRLGEIIAQKTGDEAELTLIRYITDDSKLKQKQ